jgi:glutamine synthetase adenylyltransferase
LMDAEFLAQICSLENGWQEPNTLGALERAAGEGRLQNAEKFLQSYRELRRYECVLRRWSYAGETTLPDDPAPLYRVAVRCGFPDAEAFMSAVQQHRAVLRTTWNCTVAAA